MSRYGTSTPILLASRNEPIFREWSSMQGGFRDRLIAAGAGGHITGLVAKVYLSRTTSLVCCGTTRSTGT